MMSDLTPLSKNAVRAAELQTRRKADGAQPAASGKPSAAARGSDSIQLSSQAKAASVIESSLNPDRISVESAKERVSSGFYDRDEVRDEVVERIMGDDALYFS